MTSAISTRLLALLTAAILWITGVGQWLLARVCEFAVRLGRIGYRVAEYLGGILQVVRSAFVNVFQGIKSMLNAFFSWETLFWFGLTFGLIGFIIWRNDPSGFSRWLDEAEFVEAISSPIAVIILAPILLVLIALGRMQGVRWHSRQMGLVGIMLLAGLLSLALFVTRRSTSEQHATLDTMARDEAIADTRVTPAREHGSILFATSPFDSSELASGGGVQVLAPVPEANVTIDADEGESAPAVVSAPVAEEPAEDVADNEAPGSVQVLDPMATPVVSDTVSQDETTNPTVIDELETVKIQLLHGTEQLVDVESLPEWVELARESNDRRTICADMQWHPTTLATWGQGTPEQVQSQQSSSTMLCGEVVTLHDSRQEADLVVTVSHVGSLDEGERFVEFATERIVRDRLFRLYPEIQGWSRGSSFTRISNASMIAERCVETSLLYVGEFEEPIYTFHAHVHLEQDEEAVIFSQWKQNEQYERVVMGGIGLGVLAWLFAIVAGYMHINLATGGRHRTILRICSLACIAAPLLLVLIKIRMT